VERGQESAHDPGWLNNRQGSVCHGPGPAHRVTVIRHEVIKNGISCRNAAFMIREYTCRLGSARTGKAHRQARPTRLQAPTPARAGLLLAPERGLSGCGISQLNTIRRRIAGVQTGVIPA
jgi:hypothetical protein